MLFHYQIRYSYSLCPTFRFLISMNKKIAIWKENFRTLHYHFCWFNFWLQYVYLQNILVITLNLWRNRGSPQSCGPDGAAETRQCCKIVWMSAHGGRCKTFGGLPGGYQEVLQFFSKVCAPTALTWIAQVLPKCEISNWKTIPPAVSIWHP